MIQEPKVHFSKPFEYNVNHHFPNTNLGKLQVLIRKRITQVIKKLGSIGNDVTVKKVHFEIGEDCPQIRIEIDKCPARDIACLEIRPDIIQPQLIAKIGTDKMRSGDLVKIIEELDNPHYRFIYSLSKVALLHEFGHLQDVQNPEFGYTGEVEDRKTHNAVDKIWNVVLDKRFVTHRLPIKNIDKCGVRNNFQCEWKCLTCHKPRLEDFELLWKKNKYDYCEICSMAERLLECYSQ